MVRHFLAGAVVVHSLCLSAMGQDLQTVAEKSDYKATSRHADVLEFCETLAAKSPLVRLTTMGMTGEGRKMPMLILADPPVSTPAEAKASGKLVVYVQANIHAGEVDGKEGLLMLARDIALGPDRALLKNLILLFVPNFNPDGNEKISANNRRSQNGPPEVGVRANAAGFDLNRDFVKLETPEVQAFVRVMNAWDPALAIDCHTTNGSFHRYLLTYDGPRHPNTGTPMVEAIRDKMLPEVGKLLEQKTGFKSFVYGNFSRDKSKWETYGHSPRYSIQYVGLRGRIGILSESYSYASFKDRVTASREFVRSWLEYMAAHADEIRKLMAENQQGDSIAVRTGTATLKKTKALGYEEETKDGRRAPILDKPRDYELELVTLVEPAEQAEIPWAYAFPPKFAAAAANLRKHGIAVTELKEPFAVNVAAYTVEKVNKAKNPFQNHSETDVDVVRGDKGPKLTRDLRTLPAGTFIVHTNQPLRILAAYLLEPRSEDGLTTWNFFDDGLKPGGEFPVLRVPDRANLPLQPVRSLQEKEGAARPESPGPNQFR